MKKKFSWKVFISFGLTYSFIFIFISGIMLYTAPPGRYAHWVDWKLLGFTKDGWQGIHIIFSVSFAILSIFHLFTINWSSFLSYLKLKKRKGINKNREFYWSTILTLVFFFGIIFSVPPFNYAIDFGEYLTESWETVEEEPPIPHAELLTLTELAEQLKLSSVDEITRKLTIHEIKFDNTEQTLQELAIINETTPVDIYSQISKKSGAERQGSGIGRKTIEVFGVEVGKTPDEVMKILQGNGIKAKKGQTLREIGDNNNIPTRDIFELFSK
ncbi:MAG: DUF4405 domain-containing protein [Mariniphaga sp.]|nr:DUF4405 domain-containing protein [Mariniphaga sp.]